MKENNEVTEYINNAPAQQKEILKTLRQVIHKTIPNTAEGLKWGIPVFSKTKIFTYLRSTKNHVALGIYNVDRISDPKGLLEGTGKNMKHLKFKKIDDIDKKLIEAWLKTTAD